MSEGASMDAALNLVRMRAGELAELNRRLQEELDHVVLVANKAQLLSANQSRELTTLNRVIRRKNVRISNLRKVIESKDLELTQNGATLNKRSEQERFSGQRGTLEETG